MCNNIFRKHQIRQTIHSRDGVGDVYAGLKKQIVDQEYIYVEITKDLINLESVNCSARM